MSIIKAIILLVSIPFATLAQGSYTDIEIQATPQEDSVIVYVSTTLQDIQGVLLLDSIQWSFEDTLGYDQCHIYYSLETSEEIAQIEHTFNLPVVDAWNCTMLIKRYINGEIYQSEAPNGYLSDFVIKSWCWLSVEENIISSEKIFNIRIFTLNGYELVNEKTNHYNISNLNNGTYIITLSQNQNYKTLKILK